MGRVLNGRHCRLYTSPSPGDRITTASRRARSRGRRRFNFEEAHSAVQAGLAANPSFTISRFRAAVESDSATFLAQRERLYEGMRKARVPEG